MSSLNNRENITVDTIPVKEKENSRELTIPEFPEEPHLSQVTDEKPKHDRLTSPGIKKVFYSFTVLAIVAGLYHLWLDPIVIRAPNGQNITTALPDHSIVELNSGTSLTYYRNFGWIERKVKLNGEAFFVVNGSSKPFEVETSNGIITSVNTKFNVRSWNSDPGDETVVTLVEGKLDFAPGSNPDKKVRLHTGQTSRISKNHPTPTMPDNANVSHILSWRQNGLSFEAQPLSVIFSEMERRYNIMIRTTNNQILTDSLTIFIARPSGPKEVLNNICQAANLKFNSTNKGYVISPN